VEPDVLELLVVPVAAEEPVVALPLERGLEEVPPAPAVVLDPDSPDVAVEALVVPVPETVSPTWPESETIVPLSGAKSFVFPTAC
jgi:hypothetical protein